MIEIEDDWAFEEFEDVATQRFVSPNTGITHYSTRVPKENNS